MLSLSCFGHKLKLFVNKIRFFCSPNRIKSYYHVVPSEINIADMNIKILPYFDQNYMFLITDSITKKTVAIDPAEPGAILALTESECLSWDHVLITDHHKDTGNQFIKHCRAHIQIIAGDERVDLLDHKINHFDLLQLDNLRFRCLFTPGHTKGHFCYYVESLRSKERCIFTGDLLISGGVGCLNVPPAQMYHSLQMLYSLPDDTRIFSSQESTIKNLKFAVKVEPDNTNAMQRLNWAAEHALKHWPLMLSTIGQEKLFNPFMRVTEKSVQQYCETTDPYCIVQKLNEELHSEQKQVEDI